MPEPPPPVGFDAATRAAVDPATLEGHPFPTCFVCGPARDDGLRIFPGEGGDGLLAAPWTPPGDLSDGGGQVAAPFVWAALDCPSGWSLSTIVDPGTVAVLGRFTVAIHERPQADSSCVLVAEATARDGRKLMARSALYTESGHLLAAADAVWIATR